MTKLKTLKNITLSATMVGAGMLTSAMPAYAEFPEQPITLIVPWGAGGGTVATGRMVVSDQCEPVSARTMKLSLVPHQGCATQQERQRG